MKARLGELQARLDSHERHRLQQGAQSGHDIPHGITAVPVTFNQNLPPPSVNVIAGATMASCHGGQASPDAVAADLHHPRPPMLQTNGTCENHIEESESSPNGRYLNSPPNSHSSSLRTQNGLLSPPGRSDPEPSAKVSQDFVLDCLHFQSQLLNRHDNLEHNPSYPSQESYSQRDGVSQGLLS